MFSLVKKQNEASLLENRRFTLFPHFTISDYLDGKYQTEFNDAMADQFIFSQTLKSKMHDFTNFINYNDLNKDICKNEYVKVVNNVSVFDCDTRLVYLPYSYNKGDDESFTKNIDNLSLKTGDISLYYYFINDSNNFDFRTSKKIYNFKKYFKDENWDEFTFKDYKEFKKYFYKTDHHWNYFGSYKGYEDIINLLFDEEKVKNPVKTVNYKMNFYGTLAREGRIFDFREPFKVYKFNFDRHDEYINGFLSSYDNSSRYDNKIVSHKDTASHYADYYGVDYGEIVFDYYNQSDKENLLIISNSFSNPINGLIASHFHKTYVIDLRHYKDDLHVVFDYKKYLEENEIDKVLVIGNINFFNDENLGKWGI